VDVGKTVGSGRGVLVEREASVVATASSMPGRLGVAVLPGNEQDVKTNTVNSINKYCLMGRLYKFSEQIDCRGVLRVKE
jgi:hypothetical protein